MLIIKEKERGALNHVRGRKYLTVEELPLQQLAAACSSLEQHLCSRRLPIKSLVVGYLLGLCLISFVMRWWPMADSLSKGPANGRAALKWRRPIGAGRYRSPGLSHASDFRRFSFRIISSNNFPPFFFFFPLFFFVCVSLLLGIINAVEWPSIVSRNKNIKEMALLQLLLIRV